MIDPEVARLRRLRDEALRVREIARRLGNASWGIGDPLLARGACACWRLARVVTGKLVEHPFWGYQQSAGLGSLIGNRIAARWIALVSKRRSAGLKSYAAELESLARQLGDARALTWSTEFSDTLGRSQSEIKTLLRTIAAELQGTEPESAPLETRVPARTPRSGSADRTGNAPRTDRLVGELAKGFESDWPYLAF